MKNKQELVEEGVVYAIQTRKPNILQVAENFLWEKYGNTEIFLHFGYDLQKEIEDRLVEMPYEEFLMHKNF